MNAFPGMGNFDPSKMDPAQLKQMLNLFSGMSDDQIRNTMKMMNIDMDPSVIRNFVDQLKNADDATLNQFKEQYSKGKVNMNSFSKHSKSESKVKEAKKLIDENKLNDAIDLCDKEINELKDLKIEEQKEKDEVNKILVDLYDMKTLARYTTQDLDLCIKECQEEIFLVVVRMFL